MTYYDPHRGLKPLKINDLRRKRPLPRTKKIKPKPQDGDDERKRKRKRHAKSSLAAHRKRAGRVSSHRYKSHFKRAEFWHRTRSPVR